MNINDLNTAANLNNELADLDSEIQAVSGAGLQVTIGGVYQDAELVNAARPAIIALLQARRSTILVALQALGVITQ